MTSTGKQADPHFVGRAAWLRGQARQLRFEFASNLQIHQTGAGCIDNTVNRQLIRRPRVGRS